MTDLSSVFIREILQSVIKQLKADTNGICTPRNFGRVRRLAISGNLDII